jgi:DNA-binding winged helix-turn-helix (wHTH) protein/TolB-like protein
MSQPTVKAYEFSGFRIDAVRRLLAGPDGQPIVLTPKVFETLLYLVEHAGQLCEKRTLMEAIWPRLVVEENNLNQNVSTLRRVLGERPGQHRFIVTEPGRGYRFVATVNTLSDASMAAAAEWDARVQPAEPQTVVEGPAAAPPRPASDLQETERNGFATAVAARRFPNWRLGVAVAALLVLAAVVAYWLREATSPDGSASTAATPPATLEVLPNSVAVLPFEVIGADPGQIADGLHIELINRLTQAGLTVKARGAVLRYAGSPPAFATIAGEQQVESILAGTLQQAGDRLRVNVTLVDSAGFNRWSSPSYDIEPVDIFRVQADIATNVAEALRLTLSATAQQRLEHRPTDSLSAQLAYWKALAIAESGPRTEALRLLEDAVKIDPSFAEAHAQAALLYARSLVDWLSDPAPTATAQDIYRAVVEHAGRALSLDEGQAAAHTALGEANLYFWRWEEAAKAYEDAYDMNPRDLDVLVFYSNFNSYRGDFERAVELAEQVRTLNANALFGTWLAYTYSGDVDAALLWLGSHLTIDPGAIVARLNVGYIEARRGNRDAAEREFRLVEGLGGEGISTSARASLAYGYSRIGLNDDARKLFEFVESRRGTESIGDGAWAIGYLAIGDHEEASAALRRLVAKIESHEPDQAWFGSMIIKHNVLGDPTLETTPFKELRERLRGD